MSTKNTNASYEKICEYERSLNADNPRVEKSAVTAADDNVDFDYKVKNGKLVKSKDKAVPADPSAERVRCFRLVSYIPVPSLDMFLRDQDWIHHWAYCHHDKDRCKDSDGNIALKKAHTHILLYTFNQKSSRVMSKIFDRFAQTLCVGDEPLEKTLCQPCKDIVRWWRYLIHADERDTLYYHYDPADRVCCDYNYWRKLEKTQGMNDAVENKAQAMVEDYVRGMSYGEMLSRYGNYFLSYISRIRDVGNHICVERGLPIPHMACGAGDKISIDLLNVLLDSSHFNELEIAHFRIIFAYLQTTCFAHYGSSVDFYLNERN